MATKTMLAAVAVVAVVVIAAAAYAVFSDNDGNDRGSPANGIGTDLEVGDFYTISSTQNTGQASSYSLASSVASDETRYTVTGVDEQSGTVDVSVETSTGTTYETMTPQDFLDNVSVVNESFIGQYQRNDTLNYGGNTIECMVYMDQQGVGGATEVTTYDWIGVGTNVIYQTEIIVYSNATSETFRTTLVDTNMIGQGQGTAVEPPAPSTGGGIRTDLQAGDYIEFSKYDDDGDRDIERIVITRISGDTVYYREYGDDDGGRTTVDRFLSLVLYSGGGTPIASETISTAFGSIACNVYEMDWGFGGIIDADWEDRIVVWASADDNIIYKIESQDDYYDHDDRWDDWHDDIESYYLTGTSLFSGPSGGQTPGEPVQPSPSDNRFGVELQVGDYFVIQDDDDRWDDRYEIIAIDGNRLTVMETDGRETEVERMSANEFLGKILMTSQELQRGWTDTGSTEDIGGVNCQIWRERYDHDQDRIWVEQRGSFCIVWQEQDDRYDREALVELGIASLVGNP